ncbi:MAG: HIT family protein [Pigmentiphaga sp.]|nr:HIT family protein [Pigmentiphaga sp.]
MSYDPNNIFAKILRGEAPAIKLYEDEQTLAMMDIMPQSPGHVLILTKEPAETLFEMTPEGAAACIRTTQKLAHAVREALKPEGVFIGQFNGAAAGQTVPHVHFHIIPRDHGQTLKMHAREMAERPELERIARQIRAALA